MSEKTITRSEQKRRCFERWMKADHVLVHLNANSEGVSVPAHLSGNPSLTLKLSYYFQGETTNDEQGITSYLRFNGQYACCIIPWGSVWGMTSSSGENRIWPEDLPREVKLQMARGKLASVGSKLFGKKDEKLPSSTDDKPTGPETPSPNQKSHLKRVK